MINWIKSWQPGCWCFDRRPIYAEQRPKGTRTKKLADYDFSHAWVWCLWSPRAEARPHVLPHAWGFANDEDWSLVVDLIGLEPVLQLGLGESDWVYLCDMLITCDDMDTVIAREIGTLKEEERYMNARRIADQFGMTDSETYDAFLESTLLNTVSDDEPEPYEFFLLNHQLIRRSRGQSCLQRFDAKSRSFNDWTNKDPAMALIPIPQSAAMSYIRSSTHTLER